MGLTNPMWQACGRAPARAHMCLAVIKLSQLYCACAGDSFLHPQVQADWMPAAQRGQSTPGSRDWQGTSVPPVNNFILSAVFWLLAAVTTARPPTHTKAQALAKGTVRERRKFPPGGLVTEFSMAALRLWDRTTMGLLGTMPH